MVNSAKPRLTDQDVQTIKAILEVWEGPLTWALLGQRVTLVLGRSYSRQALDGHQVIKVTYQARKRRNRAIRDSMRKGTVAENDVPPELGIALGRAEAAELRVKAQEQIVERYREKFTCWLYNARNFGITEEQLNAPLPETDQKTGALWTKRKRA